MVFVRDVAHVHDGYQVQTNSVAVNGTPGALMTIRKTGGVSTLAVIDGVREALPDIEKIIPKGVTIKAIFDQSIFVKAALNSVMMGGLMAAGLTALMILLFLGNWRLTLIILASIPLSIVTAILVMYCGRADAEHHDAGRLRAGGRHPGRQRHGGDREHRAPCPRPASRSPRRSSTGRGEVGVPTLLATLCICIVFVPVFLLQGTAKYLFSPLSLSVCVSLMASLALSFTLVPVLFKFLMRTVTEARHEERDLDRPKPSRNPFAQFHYRFRTRLRRGRARATATASPGRCRARSPPPGSSSS